jgi:hypothetical protein
LRSGSGGVMAFPSLTRAKPPLFSEPLCPDPVG